MFNTKKKGETESEGRPASLCLSRHICLICRAWRNMGCAFRSWHHGLWCHSSPRSHWQWLVHRGNLPHISPRAPLLTLDHPEASFPRCQAANLPSRMENIILALAVQHSGRGQMRKSIGNCREVWALSQGTTPLTWWGGPCPHPPSGKTRKTRKWEYRDEPSHCVNIFTPLNSH